MKKELDYFTIGTSYGGNQSWFLDYSMHIGGCGAITACDCCIYFAKYINKPNLYPFDSSCVTRRDYLKFAHVMKPYLRPRAGGINTLELYIDGFSRYLADVGEHGLGFVPLAGKLPYARAREAVIQQIDRDYPVPCLTLYHRNPQYREYVWHWFLLTGYDAAKAVGEKGREFPDGGEPGDIMIKAVTYGEYEWIGLKGLWDTGYQEKGGLILFSDI